jgi:transcriptional regulator with XRE-family HTH domain
MTGARPAGELLREWRERRRLSQLDLACEAEISTRHLSFLETGRAQPSREMILRLAEQLAIPIRERNVLLVAAGFAPIFAEHGLGDPALASAKKAIEVILESQKPFPAFAMDRYWNLVASNGAIPEVYEGVSPKLRQAPINALRITLHPEGLAPRIVNFAEWRADAVARLKRQVEITADAVLMDLLGEVLSYPTPLAKSPVNPMNIEAAPAIMVPFQLETILGRLSFFTTTTMFGSPLEITLSELALECFYPADAATAEIVRNAAAARAEQGQSPAAASAKRIAS